MKEKWRDAGNGMVQNERTKEVIPIIKLRPPSGAHVIILNDEEWEKLCKLAVRRKATHPKRKHFTPEDCVRDFIRNAKLETTWHHPSSKKG